MYKLKIIHGLAKTGHQRSKDIYRLYLVKEIGRRILREYEQIKKEMGKLIQLSAK